MVQGTYRRIAFRSEIGDGVRHTEVEGMEKG